MPTPNTITFGGIQIPEHFATQHFAVLGATGSGKTLTIRILMKDVLPHIGDGSDCRAIIYDAKRVVAPILADLGLESRIVFLNPFDARCTPWHISRDVVGSDDALQFATTLIPERNHGPNQYFVDAARTILTNVIFSLSRRFPKKWTLRHLLLIFDSPDDVIRVLLSDPYTEYVVGKYSKAKSWFEVLNTVSSYVDRFRPIASAWDFSKNQPGISLDGWINEESILLLGESTRLSDVIEPINKLIFRRVTNALLDDPQIRERPSTRRTWVILDELAEAPRFDGLLSLLQKGREFKVPCLLGFQTTAALQEKYGENVRKSLLAQCQQRAALALADAETASVVAEDFGYGLTTDNKRKVVLDPGKLLALPPTGRVNGLHGFYMTALRQPFQSHIRPKELSRMLEPLVKDHGCPAFVSRPRTDMELSPWRSGEREQWDLPPLADHTCSNSQTKHPIWEVK